MDFNGISSSTVSSLASAKTGDAVGTKVLKKALDIQASSVAQLVSAATASAPSAPSGGSSIGRNINVTA